MPQTLVILGASVRAAAFSARAAGFTPFCADLFADADLRDIAHARRVDDYPVGLAVAAQSAPPGPWLYTGGLENHPELVARISSRRPLLGNRPEVLRRVRDPQLLARAIADSGLAAPDLRASPAGLPTDGSWLQKPRRGCAGIGITAWCGQGDQDDRFYFQRRIEGLACSAVYVATGRRAALLGVTRQLLAAREEKGTGSEPTALDARQSGHREVPVPRSSQAAATTTGREFQYAGSIGPTPLGAHLAAQAARIGSAVARRFDLVGLFGVDMVLAGDTLWPLEVNPRYTASIEVLERALGLKSIALHVAACREGHLPAETAPAAPMCHGKRILYAARDCVATAPFVQQALDARGPTSRPHLADIPTPGTPIAAGQPVMTLFTEAPDTPTVESALSRLATHWQARLPR